MPPGLLPFSRRQHRFSLRMDMLTTWPPGPTEMSSQYTAFSPLYNIQVQCLLSMPRAGLGTQANLMYFCFFKSVYLYVCLPIYLFERQRQRGREKEGERNLLSAASLLNLPQRLGLNQAKARSLALLPGLPHACTAQSLGPSCIAFPGVSTESWLECGAAQSVTSTCICWWHHRWWFLPLCHSASP